MAAITERGGRYLVRVRRKGFACASKTFTRRHDAVAWGRQVEVAMETGRWVEPSRQVPTLADALKDYRTAVGHKLKGAHDYGYRWDEIAAQPFAAKLLDEITPGELSRWRDEQLKTRRASTVARKLALLSAVFVWCMKERGWLNANPLTMVRRPREFNSRSRTLSARELAYLLEASLSSKAKWLPSALLVLMGSAMRRSELFSLKLQDVDFDARIAHLQDTKNGRPRDVPLCTQTLDSLRELAKKAKARGDDYLIPLGAVGSMSTRFKTTVNRARAKYETDCKIEGDSPDDSFLRDLRLHDLRHYAITLWASLGQLSLFELMSISGHHSPSMLARYTHIKPQAVAAKLATLSVSSQQATKVHQ